MAKTKLPFSVKPVLVEWVDSIGSGSWKHEVETYNMDCVSVGILIDKIKDRVVLALNANEQ